MAALLLFIKTMRDSGNDPAAVWGAAAAESQGGGEEQLRQERDEPPLVGASAYLSYRSATSRGLVVRRC